jgi:hypothetical protein
LNSNDEVLNGTRVDHNIQVSIVLNLFIPTMTQSMFRVRQGAYPCGEKMKAAQHRKVKALDIDLTGTVCRGQTP